MSNELQYMTLDQLIAYRDVINEEIKERREDLKQKMYSRLCEIMEQINDNDFEIWVDDRTITKDDIELN